MDSSHRNVHKTVLCETWTIRRITGTAILSVFSLLRAYKICKIRAIKTDKNMRPQIAVIILNYRRPHDTIECVDSVLSSDQDNFSLKIVLVDNSENSESFNVLSKTYPQIPLLVNPSNLGYAEGNNVGIRYALEQGADYVFVLNNDCVIEKDTLQKLLTVAKSSSERAILAPLVCRYDRRDQIDSCGTSMDWFRLRPRSASFKSRDDTRLPPVIETQIIPGSALFLSKEISLSAGLFNADYFLIHEDADLCLRNLKLGYQNKIITSAVVFHKISQTFNAYPGISTYYSTRNFLLLSKKHNSSYLHGIVLCGLFCLSAKRLLTLIVSKAGRAQLRWLFRGAEDYFRGVTGKCPNQNV